MNWKSFYDLLEKYNGELGRATRKEIDLAVVENPGSSFEARKIAEEKWNENKNNEKH